MIEQPQRRHRSRRRRRRPFPDQREFHIENRFQQKGESVNDKPKDKFHAFAYASSLALGHPISFSIAILIVGLWLVTGPIFKFSDTWQLVINTATTIITFVMVFLIQNMQNRDAKAIHLKLDELLHALRGARNRMIDLEKMSDEELDRLQKEFERVRQKAPPEKCEDKSPSPE